MRAAFMKTFVTAGTVLVLLAGCQSEDGQDSPEEDVVTTTTVAEVADGMGRVLIVSAATGVDDLVADLSVRAETDAALVASNGHHHLVDVPAGSVDRFVAEAATHELVQAVAAADQSGADETTTSTTKAPVTTVDPAAAFGPDT